MPVYQYIHAETGQIFEELRPVSKRNKPFIAPDGKKCKKIISRNIYGHRSDRECFEIDPGWVKSCAPKYIKFNDGHRERYDSTKHC